MAGVSLLTLAERQQPIPRRPHTVVVDGPIKTQVEQLVAERGDPLCVGMSSAAARLVRLIYPDTPLYVVSVPCKPMPGKDFRDRKRVTFTPARQSHPFVALLLQRGDRPWEFCFWGFYPMALLEAGVEVSLSRDAFRESLPRPMPLVGSLLCDFDFELVLVATYERIQAYEHNLEQPLLDHDHSVASLRMMLATFAFLEDCFVDQSRFGMPSPRFCAVRDAWMKLEQRLARWHFAWHPPSAGECGETSQRLRNGIEHSKRATNDELRHHDGLHRLAFRVFELLSGLATSSPVSAPAIVAPRAVPRVQPQIDPIPDIEDIESHMPVCMKILAGRAFYPSGRDPHERGAYFHAYALANGAKSDQLIDKLSQGVRNDPRHHEYTGGNVEHYIARAIKANIESLDKHASRPPSCHTLQRENLCPYVKEQTTDSRVLGRVRYQCLGDMVGRPVAREEAPQQWSPVAYTQLAKRCSS